MRQDPEINKNVTNKDRALKLAEQSYNKTKNISNALMYTMIRLWNNELEKAFEISKEFLKNKNLLRKSRKIFHYS